uniref:Uncharacterized protein n=1 Tax=viral metagenome TaxID=1070528 RepID=A0A6C0E955_9ZZZZ
MSSLTQEEITQIGYFFDNDPRAPFFIANNFNQNFDTVLNKKGDETGDGASMASILKKENGLTNGSNVQNFTNFVEKMGAFHRDVDQDAKNKKNDGKHVTIINEIYKKWNTLSPNVKLFYNKFVSIIYYNTGNVDLTPLMRGIKSTYNTSVSNFNTLKKMSKDQLEILKKKLDNLKKIRDKPIEYFLKDNTIYTAGDKSFANVPLLNQKIIIKPYTETDSSIDNTYYTDFTNKLTAKLGSSNIHIQMSRLAGLLKTLSDALDDNDDVVFRTTLTSIKNMTNRASLLKNDPRVGVQLFTNPGYIDDPANTIANLYIELGTRWDVTNINRQVDAVINYLDAAKNDFTASFNETEFAEVINLLNNFPNDTPQATTDPTYVATTVDNTWSTLSENQYDGLDFVNNARLNIKKLSPDPSDKYNPLFKNALPVDPNDEYKNIDTFRAAYSTAYKNGTVTVAITGKPQKYFSISHAKWVEAALTAIGQSFKLTAGDMVPTTGTSDMNKDVEDLIALTSTGFTQREFRRGPDHELYVYEQGKQKYKVSDARHVRVVSEDGTVTTGIKTNANSKVNQEEIAQCLLQKGIDRLQEITFDATTGKPASTNDTCLKFFTNRGAFSQAINDVQRTDPLVLRRIFKSLDIKYVEEDQNGRRVKIPQKYNSWYNNIKNTTGGAAKVLDTYPELATYIKTLINFGRNKAYYFNEDIANSAPLDGISTNEFGLPPSRNIMPNSPDAYNVGAGMLALAGGSMTFGAGLPILVGGNRLVYSLEQKSKPLSNSKILTNMFSKAFAEMRRNGKTLVDEDRQRIDSGISKIHQIEESLNKILTYIETYNRIEQGLLAAGNDLKEEDVSIKDIQQAATLKTQISNGKNDLISNLNKQTNSLNALMRAMLTSVWPNLIKVAHGNIGQLGNMNLNAVMPVYR